MTTNDVSGFPMLAEILKIKGLPARAMYTTRESAEIFGVSQRAIIDWIAHGRIPSRRLPGRARFLSSDLEAFLQRSGGNEEKQRPFRNTEHF